MYAKEFFGSKEFQQLKLDILNEYELKNIKDYIHVQKQVIRKLKSDNFFRQNDGGLIVKNNASGMIIEITPDGIKETLGEGSRFEKLGGGLKISKIATLRNLPDILENGDLVEDNVKNIHNKKSSVKYAYVQGATDLNGKRVKINVSVRKSPQKNKFWIHQVYIKSDDAETPAGENYSKTGYKQFSTSSDKTISQNDL